MPIRIDSASEPRPEKATQFNGTKASQTTPPVHVATDARGRLVEGAQSGVEFKHEPTSTASDASHSLAKIEAALDEVGSTRPTIGKATQRLSRIVAALTPTRTNAGSTQASQPEGPRPSASKAAPEPNRPDQRPNPSGGRGSAQADKSARDK